MSGQGVHNGPLPRPYLHYILRSENWKIVVFDFSINNFLYEMLQEFRDNHPNSIVEDVDFRKEDDGSVTMIVTSVEPIDPSSKN